MGQDEETDIESILDKELGPLMVDNLDPEERLLAEGLSDRGFRSRYVQPLSVTVTVLGNRKSVTVSDDRSTLEIA